MGAMTRTNAGAKSHKSRNRRRYQLLFMALPLMIMVIMFAYVPLFGWAYAFFDYKPGVPLFSNEFVGFKYFEQFLTDRWDMHRVMKNTLVLALLNYAVSPLPMIFAILLNSVHHTWYKKTIQTLTTFPNFISWIIVYSLAFQLFSSEGLITEALANLGLIRKGYNVLSDASAVYWFQTLMGQWKGLGWSSIIYRAAIAGIDQELYEAAAIDGANRFQSTLHITVPGLIPTFIVLLLLGIGNFMNVGFDQYYIFKNAGNSDTIEVLDIYVYRIGMQNYKYSYGIAIGIMKSVVSMILLFSANGISKLARDGQSIF